MPILNVNESESVIVIKRSMNPASPGSRTSSYYDPKTADLFGDAKSRWARSAKRSRTSKAYASGVALAPKQSVTSESTRSRRGCGRGGRSRAGAAGLGTPRRQPSAARPPAYARARRSPVARAHVGGQIRDREASLTRDLRRRLADDRQGCRAPARRCSTCLGVLGDVDDHHPTSSPRCGAASPTQPACERIVSSRSAATRAAVSRSPPPSSSGRAVCFSTAWG